MDQLPEYIEEGIPNICGAEPVVEAAVRSGRDGPVFFRDGWTPFGGVHSAFAIGLHMHQPLIPAGGAALRTAQLISNLKHMLDNPGIGDNHNAPYFCGATQGWPSSSRSLLRKGARPALCSTTRGYFCTDCGR